MRMLYRSIFIEGFKKYFKAVGEAAEGENYGKENFMGIKTHARSRAVRRLESYLRRRSSGSVC